MGVSGNSSRDESMHARLDELLKQIKILIKDIITRVDGAAPSGFCGEMRHRESECTYGMGFG